jgi:lysophospholipase L1-like esterase
MNRLLIFGDSISTSFHGDGGYIRKLQETMIFDDIQTLAISASGLSSITPNALALQYKKHEDLIRQASHLIIWHGTNDWYYNVPLDQFQMELVELCKDIRRINQNISILLITPLIRYQATYGNSRIINGYTEHNNHGETLIDFENAIQQVALNLDTGLICMRIETPFTLQNINHYFEDGVHPNDAGYNQIVIPIIRFFKKT